MMASMDCTSAVTQTMLQQERNYQIPSSTRYLDLFPSLNASCRRRMILWMYQTVKFYGLQRETVAIAVNCMDRYFTAALSASERLRPEILRDQFQLGAMTCLYLVIKINESSALAPKSMSKLSGGKYSPKDIESCEMKILDQLQWRVNPPTSYSFVRQMVLECHECHAGKAAMKQEDGSLPALVMQQLDAAMLDSELSFDALPSDIAQAALWNWTTVLRRSNNVEFPLPKRVQRITRRLASLVNLSPSRLASNVTNEEQDHKKLERLTRKRPIHMITPDASPTRVQSDII